WSTILDRADKIGTERHGGGTPSAPVPFFLSPVKNQQRSHTKIRKAMEKKNNARYGQGVGRLHASFLWFVAAFKVVCQPVPVL
ncbi:hypothetical protein PspLS_02510, partial [Pyricularia sp. CBS 133598]